MVKFDNDLRWRIPLNNLEGTPMLERPIKVKFDVDFLGLALDQTTRKASHW